MVMRGDSGTMWGYAGAMEEEAGTMWRDAVAVWEESRAMCGTDTVDSHSVPGRVFLSHLDDLPKAFSCHTSLSVPARGSGKADFFQRELLHCLENALSEK